MTHVVQIASYLPEKVMTNVDLEGMVDTSDAWIKKRTGIECRAVCASDEDVATLAIQAVSKLTISLEDVDAVVVATCTPNKAFPSVACQVAAYLGLKGVLAFDLNAACSGLLYALFSVDNMIKASGHKKVLLVTADAMSKIVDWEDRGTCVLFGDGACAWVLGEDVTESAISGMVLGSDGAFGPCLNTTPMFSKAPVHIKMSGKEVFKKAVQTFEQVAHEVLKAAGMSLADIQWVIPHQANARIIDATAKALKVGSEKIISTVDHHANTSAASIGLALDEGIREGRIVSGDRCLLIAFGAGFTWGGCVLTI